MDLVSAKSSSLKADVCSCSLVVDTWQKMGQEKNLSSSIVDHLLDMLLRCQPYEELTTVDSKTKKPARRAILMPFSVCFKDHSALLSNVNQSLYCS